MEVQNRETTQLNRQSQIPDCWSTNTIIPLFNKGNKKDPTNYRSINLLSTVLKLTTKVPITNKLNSLLKFADEHKYLKPVDLV